MTTTHRRNGAATFPRRLLASVVATTMLLAASAAGLAIAGPAAAAEETVDPDYVHREVVDSAGMIDWTKFNSPVAIGGSGSYSGVSPTPATGWWYGDGWYPGIIGEGRSGFEALGYRAGVALQSVCGAELDEANRINWLHNNIYTPTGETIAKEQFAAIVNVTVVSNAAPDKGPWTGQNKATVPEDGFTLDLASVPCIADIAPQLDLARTTGGVIPTPDLLLDLSDPGLDLAGLGWAGPNTIKIPVGDADPNLGPFVLINYVYSNSAYGDYHGGGAPGGLLARGPQFEQDLHVGDTYSRAVDLSALRWRGGATNTPALDLTLAEEAAVVVDPAAAVSGYPGWTRDGLTLTFTLTQALYDSYVQSGWSDTSARLSLGVDMPGDVPGMDSWGFTTTPELSTLHLLPALDPPAPTPAAEPDAVATPVNEPISVPLLANDTLLTTVSSISDPNPLESGSVAIAADRQSAIFSPAPGFSGTSTFTYVGSAAGGATASATATVTVTPIDAPPVVNPTAVDDSTTIHRPVDTATIAVLANDATPNAGATVTVGTQPAHGTATANPDGTISYKAAAGFVGADAFTYAITDSLGGASTPATVAVTVLAAPVVQPPVVDPPVVKPPDVKPPVVDPPVVTPPTPVARTTMKVAG